MSCLALESPGLLPSPRAGNAWCEDLFQPLSFPTGVPSGPRNVISIVNETSIILEWNPPRETGGRDDVTYNIVCKKCRSDRRACSRCDDNVEFVPRQLGLTETRVFISSLWAHTPYTFEIQAVNGVSNKSPFPPQHVSVNITTNQAGESRGAGCDARTCACCLSPTSFMGEEGAPALSCTAVVGAGVWGETWPFPAGVGTWLCQEHRRQRGWGRRRGW